MDASEKKCFKVTNSRQFQVLVSLMEGNLQLARCIPSNTREKLSAEEAWNEIAREVNSFGPPERTGFEWKKIWGDLKCRTKKKVLENTKILNASEDGSSRLIFLSDLEQSVDRILQFSTMATADESEEFDTVFNDLLTPYDVKIETDAAATTSQHDRGNINKCKNSKAFAAKRSKQLYQQQIGKRKIDKQVIQFKLLQQQVQTQDKMFKVMKMQAAATKAIAEATNRQAEALATIADSTKVIAQSVQEALKHLKSDSNMST
ncbi:uncharacterized protein LOC135954646 [Calliphora vicina]|uniref:uncharacterized protein LOC135954646 n=1 Tax=Calliphora vicina TaxID=7373 RepID=UPI00325B0AE2